MPDRQAAWDHWALFGAHQGCEVPCAGSLAQCFRKLPPAQLTYKNTPHLSNTEPKPNTIRRSEAVIQSIVEDNK